MSDPTEGAPELLTEQFQVVCSPSMKAALIEVSLLVGPKGQIAPVVRDCIAQGLPTVRAAYESIARARGALDTPPRA